MKNRVDEPKEREDKYNMGLVLAIIAAIVIIIIVAYSYLSPSRVDQNIPNATTPTVASPAAPVAAPNDTNRQNEVSPTTNPAGT